MVGDIYLNIYSSVCTIIKAHTNDMLAKYCITGIFPRTFISRKMMISIISLFYFPSQHTAALILNLALMLPIVLTAELL